MVLWEPPKKRLHSPDRVRVPKVPLHNGALNYTSELLLARLQKRDVPPSLSAAMNESEDRALRSDGLESVWAVLRCLLAFMSRKSFRVGHRLKRKGKFDLVGVTVESIAQWTGLAERTVSGVLTILREAGYVHGPSEDGANHINQPCEKQPDGSYKWLPAIRRFQPVFFAELGTLTLITQRDPAPAPTVATVHPASARQLVAALVNVHGPPDG